MSKLLLDEKPLLVMPVLATKIGLNEAIILQQMNYWLNSSKHEHDGRKWIYNTYEEWQEQFPFWSISTIRRAISKLEKDGLLIAGNFNRSPIDKTKWYTIDFDVLEGLNSPSVQNEQTSGQSEQSSVQNEQSICSDRTVQVFNLNKAIPESTTESTSLVEVVEEPLEKINPFEFYQQNGFGAIGGHIAQKIVAWGEDLSEELVVHAMMIAVEQGKLNWRYVEAILQGFVQKNIKTVNQEKAAQLAYKQEQIKKVVNGKNDRRSGRKEKLPEWFDGNSTGNKTNGPFTSDDPSVANENSEFLREKATFEAELKASQAAKVKREVIK